eukprot:CAMPEP_0198328796 /NCGR_PEP_ID=MMETSP1450-20131203/15707_1 /TAXON_ID=753684 ORGANISM="Madagascaria erythrocladiodes, Strain CCMP3234" /NCGR_SAMPLE_ID=MMETSP1450 /ASSEMBLY_ACC=CAM_ASM_001115 /LENGTH=49 /DNA_ID= /DNA_START= /DNA_END= /DNA_ORIENTATION=
MPAAPVTVARTSTGRHGSHSLTESRVLQSCPTRTADLRTSGLTGQTQEA